MVESNNNPPPEKDLVDMTDDEFEALCAKLPKPSAEEIEEDM